MIRPADLAAASRARGVRDRAKLVEVGVFHTPTFVHSHSVGN
jgi:2-hydroxychromene-2-carboxylate isomerase